ncbi:MAG: LVIVD repeat protein [Candidatus Magnetoglobus multicellularis str. Araruama]|uniref:LVIVD repeat protein n=1 Tax=Candidatus Magnetoglobus multicellularis str. Araruama TaxID=890399 RepID=A0A1V1NU56_9BACT|nr:MAG: LVIVD repeat protein [Candidatus Magnetoglobus multicellularis str. Araruama]
MDIQSPQRQKPFSQCGIPGTANLVTISQSIAFITDQEKGIYLIDISDPSVPTYLHQMNTSGTVLDIIVFQQLLVIADSKEGLIIYDISSLESPEIIGSFQLSGSIKALAMNQDTLYCVDYFSGFYTVNMTLDEPLVLNKILDMSSIESLFVSQENIFLATRYQGISIIDRNTMNLLWTIKTPGNVHHIYSTDNIIYASDGIAGLQVILFNSVQAPQIMASVNTPDSAEKSVINGQMAYIAGRSGELYIADLHHMYAKKTFIQLIQQIIHMTLFLLKTNCLWLMEHLVSKFIIPCLIRNG